MYAAYLRRKAAEDLERYRLAITGGVWANSNYDGKDSPRGKILEDMDMHIKNTVDKIYGVNQMEASELRADPLFAKALEWDDDGLRLVVEGSEPEEPATSEYDQG